MTNPKQHQQSPRIAVIGGGLAGLAAAVAAVNEGFSVDLFEARRHLGGRASSFQEPQSGELVDLCQHVSMGCCTNLADFCQRTGIAPYFKRYGNLTSIGPDARQYRFISTPWLPAPLHLLPGLLRLGYLRLGERLRILQTMRRLARLTIRDDRDFPSVEAWLQGQGESERSIRRFWAVVLVSALGDTLDRASLRAAQKVFADGFLASRHAYEVLVPQVPLGEIYDRRLGAWLASRGVAVHLDTPVKALEGDARRATAIVLPDGSRLEFDDMIVAVPWHRVQSLFPLPMRENLPGLEKVDQIAASPITGVHLWFDRSITALPHAVLIDRLGHWVFRRDVAGHYYQVVISGSRELKGRDREAVVAEVVEELASIWPATRDARLLRWRVVTHPQAVFSIGPGVDPLRPAQQTPISNVQLAGDWTATGWPATMEGAVRSGYRAVEALLGSLGQSRPIAVGDLRPTWLTRRLLSPQ